MVDDQENPPLIKLLGLRLLTLRSQKGSYIALQMNDRLYRREYEQIAEWKLYGGVNPETEYELIKELGDYQGKCRIIDSLREIVRQDLRIGDLLIVSPVYSPRAQEHSCEPGQIAFLSGRITGIKNITDLLV